MTIALERIRPFMTSITAVLLGVIMEAKAC